MSAEPELPASEWRAAYFVLARIALEQLDKCRGERDADVRMAAVEECAAYHEHIATTPPCSEALRDAERWAERFARFRPAALPATPPAVENGTTTNCPLEGVHEHVFRGPHRFQEWEPGT